MQATTAETLLAQDLSRSGLKPEDLSAYVAQEAELAAVGLKPHLYLGGGNADYSPGYIIPYFGPSGIRIPFYRLRLFKETPKGVRYLQPSNSGNWVYFPAKFGYNLLKALNAGEAPYIIITEGEKKAVKACLHGFHACALGGVYNWKSKTIVLPEATELARNREGQVIAKIKEAIPQSITADRRGVLANGLPELIGLVKQYNLKVVIIFDSDWPVKPDVQRAAAELASEFRFNGIPTDNIRQVHLLTGDKKKIGLDDYLELYDSAKLGEQCTEAIARRTAYPEHPELRSYIARSLDGQMLRSEFRELSTLIISDLDRRGIRMVEESSQTPYFFDDVRKRLMPVNLLHHHEEPLHETEFGKFLYQTYDVAQADSKLVTWIAAGFTGERPVESVEPKRVLTLTKDGLAFQLNDGQFLHITGKKDEPAKLYSNGSLGILFRAGQVESIDGLMLIKQIKQQIEWLRSGPAYEEMYWATATSQFKWLRPHEAKIMGILSYLSPWLQRWRGSQLPVELMIGEPGSGKSSMYALRLQILTGRPALRNQPTDIRDWYASITSQGGMHVTDNIAFATKEIRQRISDEICRLVTEPAPTVEMRQLFTTSDNLRIPVHVTFAMTGIQQPFTNADIMQRSVIMELSAIGESHNADWTGAAIKRRNGRMGWLAHHLAVLHCFFNKVYQDGAWDESYRSSHRLANFEQLFRTMGELLRVPDLDDITRKLSESSQGQVSEYDWTMEALQAFSEQHVKEQAVKPTMVYNCYDISSWIEMQPEFEENQVACNSRRLARYIKSHAFMVEKLTGLHDVGKVANRQVFKIKVR